MILRGLDGTARRVLAGSDEATSTPPVLTGNREPAPEDGHTYELVIAGGRVVDPESGFDHEADVGVEGGTIRSISLRPLRGRERIDATGLVVAPGFIDLLSYDPNPFGIWFKVADGVTTNLGMHGIDAAAGEWFGFWEGAGSPCHFGGAFDAPWARSQLLGLEPDEEASPEQVAELAALADRNLLDGFLGIDLEPEYTPGVAFAEIAALGRVAATRGVPCFFHGRYSDVEPPGTNADTLDEILRTARETGAAVHVEHIISTGGTFSMEASLATLEDARADGLDVTACMYPYDYWATYLGSPRFNDGWQERFRIDYGDLQIAGTDERLTATTFERHRADNKLAAAFAIPEDDVRTAMRSPFVMLGSDGILEPEQNNHPRGAGTFARTLGRYVRDEQVVSLRQALAKMTVMPARRLEGRSPDLRRKGRLQEGADADITVFDPATVTDRATVENPATESVGIEWVLVGGIVVKEAGTLHRDRQPGRPVRAAF